MMLIDNENITETVTEVKTETIVESFGGSDYENSELETTVGVSEFNEYVSVIADSTAEISHHIQIQTVLLMSIICVIGIVAGLLGALTWRSNIK